MLRETDECDLGVSSDWGKPSAVHGEALFDSSRLQKRSQVAEGCVEVGRTLAPFLFMMRGARHFPLHCLTVSLKQ